MAVANAGTVQVDFQANAAAFNRQLQQVNARLKTVESGFSSLDGIARKALGFLTVGFAVNFIRSAAEAADNAGKLADKLGITTERLAAFQLAAADAGTSQETLSKLFTDAQRRLGDAANGTGEAAKTLQLFGLSVRDLQRLAPDELFLRYADSINTLKTRSEQFSAAQALFGRSAQEAFTLIEAGRPAIEAAAATVDRLGLALNRVDIRKIEEANDKIGLLGKVTQAFGQQLAAAFAPFVSEFVDQLTNAGVAADDARTSFDKFARSVFFTFEVTANAARVFDAAVSTAFLTVFTVVESAAGAFSRLRDAQAGVYDFVGMEKFANSFRESSAKFAEAELFAAVASEQAAARIVNAQQNFKTAEQILAEGDAIIARAQARAAEAQAAQDAITVNLGTVSEPQVEAFNTNLLLREDLQRMHFDRLLQQQQIFQEASAELTKRLDVDEFIRHQTFREQAAIAAEDRILVARQRATNAGLALLQTFAGKSKAVAIALVAINKARAIAEAIQNTSVAVTRTLASLPYPANIAAAASIKAFGALEVGLIAASAFGEISQISSSSGSGAPIGSPTNPVFTERGGTDQTIGGASRNEITVIVEGVMTPGAAMAVAEALKDVIDNSDVRIIGKNSAQADEIRRGS